MPNVLAQQPGQVVTIVQQILGLDGYREDGYSFSGSGPNGVPVIARVVLPNGSLAPNFPQAMTQLDTGLYSYSFTLPTGGASIGLYLVDVYWYHPDTYFLQQDYTLVNVTAPYGVYSVLPVPQ